MRSESIPLSITHVLQTLSLGFDTAQSDLKHNAVVLKVWCIVAQY